MSAVLWMDLLGYGGLLEKAHWDPASEAATAAIERIRKFHNIAEMFADDNYHIFILNDGLVSHRTLSTRSNLHTFDFINRSYELFNIINNEDKKDGFPGVRAVLAAGFRLRRPDQAKPPRRNLQPIIRHAEKNKISIEEAIHKAASYRPFTRQIPELQANFAFSRAYMAESGGSRKGLSGPNFYLDTSLTSGNLPEWISWDNVVYWADKGMTTIFANVKSIDTKMAKTCKYKDILNAHDVAISLTNDKNIWNRL